MMLNSNIVIDEDKNKYTFFCLFFLIVNVQKIFFVQIRILLAVRQSEGRGVTSLRPERQNKGLSFTSVISGITRKVTGTKTLSFLLLKTILSYRDNGTN